MNPTDYRASHQLICELLRGILRDAVQAGPGAAGGISSVECQAVLTLYMLLMDHPIDRRGRCRSCRRPGAVFGPRWRRCRVHSKATLCLHQPDEALLLRLLAHELGLAAAPPPATDVAPGGAPASDPDDTDVPPAIAADPPTEPLHTSAVPFPLTPRGFRGTGRPDPDHGGAGEHPKSPRLRRGPSEDPSPGPSRSLLSTGGITWPS